jgi:hypothetical protein
MTKGNRTVLSDVKKCLVFFYCDEIGIWWQRTDKINLWLADTVILPSEGAIVRLG